MQVLIIIMKKIESIEALLEFVDKSPVYNTDIKGKRLRRQLQSLQQSQFKGLKFLHFEVTDIAITINISVATPKDEVVLRFRIDHQSWSSYGYCKDLLSNILKNQAWGPSFTLPLFLENLPELANSLAKNKNVIWSYHIFFDYTKEELQAAAVKLFNVEQYEWEYKVLKITRKRILGVTPDSFLLFEAVSGRVNVYRLELWMHLKDILEVKATAGKKNCQFEIKYSPDKEMVMYLGAGADDEESILESLNPLHSVEKKIKKIQKEGVADYDDAIQSYSTLIEHYSLTNRELSQKYMLEMRKLIESHYKLAPQQQPQIQT